MATKKSTVAEGTAAAMPLAANTPSSRRKIAVPQCRRQAAEGSRRAETKPAPAAPARVQAAAPSSSGMNTHGRAASPAASPASPDSRPGSAAASGARPARSPRGSRPSGCAARALAPPRRPTRRRRCWPSNSPATPAPAGQTASPARPRPAARQQQGQTEREYCRPPGRMPRPPLRAPKRSLAQPISGSVSASTARAASSTPPTAARGRPRLSV